MYPSLKRDFNEPQVFLWYLLEPFLKLEMKDIQIMTENRILYQISYINRLGEVKSVTCKGIFYLIKGPTFKFFHKLGIHNVAVYIAARI